MIDGIRSRLARKSPLFGAEACRVSRDLQSLAPIRYLAQQRELWKQMNLSPAQIGSIWRERKVWFQVARNFRDLEGSWILGLKKMSAVFEGRPAKTAGRS